MKQWTPFRCAALAVIGLGAASVVLYACGGGGDSSLPEGPFDLDGGGTTGEGSAGNDGGTSDGGSGTTTAQAACDAIFGQQVKTFATCCNAADLAADPARTWNSFDSLSASLCVQSVTAGVAAGRISFDDAKLKSCLDTNTARYAPPAGCNYALDTTEETLIIGDPAPIDACDAVIVGKGVVGRPCASPDECQFGLTCLGYHVDLLADGGISRHDGTCEMPPSQGVACGPLAADGGPGNSNAASSSTHPACTNAWCAFGTCAPFGTSGQACAGDATCATGLKCHDGVCGAAGRSDVNGDCKDGRHDCKPGLRCDGPDDGGLGACVAKLDAGAACTGGPVNDDTNVCKGRCGADAGLPGQCVSYCSSN